MATKFRFAPLAIALASTFALKSASAADTANLVAPIYTGAVPAVLADGVNANAFYTLTVGGMKALDCSARIRSTAIGGDEITAQEAEAAGQSPGPWCFLSRDSIEKVKAFYDKAVGPMRAIQGEKGEHGFIVFAERAWYAGSGEESAPGFGYSSVSVHALSPPRALGSTTSPRLPGGGFAGQEAYKFYAESRHFGGFVDGVDWFGDPSKRKPAELDAVYKQYAHLESALFQVKGSKLERADITLRARYDQLRAERQKGASLGQANALLKVGAAAGANNDASPTASENAQFNSVMQKDPQLAQRYMALTQQAMQLMAQGKDDEADEVFAKIDELEASNPQLAALNAQQEERSAKVGAAHKAQEDAVLASGNRQLNDAIWGTALEYVKAVDNEDYYTLIVIDNKLKGYEKDYSKDRALIDADTAGWVEQAPLTAWNIRYEQPTPGASAQASRAPSTSAAAAAAEQGESEDESPKEQAKKGLKGAFKGLLNR